MKKIMFLFLCYIYITTALAQQKEYSFNKSRTSQTIAKYTPGTFQVFKVVNKEISIPEYDTSMAITGQYKEMRSNFDKLHSDSIKYSSSYQLELEKYNDIDMATSKIGGFLKSSEKFKDKSHFLIDAQNIMIKYGDYLIYSNADVNKDKRKEFLTLRMDEANLRSHLIRVGNSIDANNRTPQNKSSQLSSALSRARESLQKTNKYDVAYNENGKVKTQKGLIIDSELDDLTTIEGTFSFVGTFSYISESTIKYAKNQLVETESGFPLIHNALKNEYYLDAGYMKLTYECGTNQEISDVISTINKAGYKTSDAKGDYIIHTTNGNITLTADIFEQVKKNNIIYISEISLSVKTFNSLLSEGQPFIDKLANHFNAYRSRTMTTDRLTVWKQDVTKADGIINKMKSLKGAEKENITNFNNQFPTERLKIYNDFWGVVMGSKQILGL